MAKLENLRILAKTVDKNKVKNIHIIGNSNSSNSVSDYFYEALLANKFQRDDEYKEFLYPNQVKNKAYYKLKDRLQERLINTLFFIDTNNQDYSPISKAYYNCHKKLAAIKILLGKTARKPAINLAHKVIQKSIEFTFTDITLELAKILRLHYGVSAGDEKKFDYYNNLVHINISVYQAELKAEEYYAHICSFYVKSTLINTRILPIIEKYITELNELNNKYSSYRLYIHHKSLLMIYFEMQKNKWNELLDLCNDIINYYTLNSKFASSNLVSITLLRKVECLFFLRRFKEGEEIAIQGLNLGVKESLNWFFIADIYFILLLHSKQFNKAKDIFISVNKNNHINNKFHHERKKIQEAFIHYLLRIGKIKEQPGDKKLKPFRLGKFLNEMPVYSKDKRGSNITILILQILFLLEDKKYNTIIDRAESLKSYTHRYLKEDETYRSNCFIKMLLCLPETGFQKDKTLKKAKKYIDLLHAVPLEKARQSPEVEVMPYEVLWEFALDSLDRQ
ncbi:MAG: hypothetical protein R2824_08340 [Saprospiraceae bacterium]